MLTSRFPRLCRVLVVVVGRNINQGWEKGGAPRVGYFYHQAKAFSNKGYSLGLDHHQVDFGLRARSNSSRVGNNSVVEKELEVNLSEQSMHQVLKRMPKRWFTNPYEDYNNETKVGVTLGDAPGVRKYALKLMEDVFEKGSEDGDGGLYVGAVGCTYMYLHVAKALSLEEQKKFAPLAYKAFQTQTEFYRKKPSGREDLVAFLLGKAGYYAVGAVLGKEMGDEKLSRESLQGFVEGVEVCKPVDFLGCGGDELLVGRAGYLCGALWLQQKLGQMPVPRENLKEVWTAMIESGKQYSKSHSSPSPLMYSYYDTEYLGAAHGLCGILQVLLSFPTFLNENSEAAHLVKQSIDYYLTLQDKSGNFPCAMDEVGPGRARAEKDMLVHWCHGAPGAIYMLAKAFLHYKDVKYLEACKRCGDVVWSKGLLRKGPGICHGVAGNGYVFLIINNLLEQHDSKSLYRANKFVEFLHHPQFMAEARRPDTPFSLYEGYAGTVCFIMDTLHPQTAEFPFFNLNNNYL